MMWCVMWRASQCHKSQAIKQPVDSGRCGDSAGSVTPTSASNKGYPKVREDFTNTKKAHTWVFFRLKVPTRAFTFKTLC